MEFLYSTYNTNSSSRIFKRGHYTKMYETQRKQNKKKTRGLKGWHDGSEDILFV
jgi:hypothetical protein